MVSLDDRAPLRCPPSDEQVVHAERPPQLDEDIREVGALALEADVSDERAVVEAAAETEAAWGRLDGLINNAGWMPGSHPVLDLDIGVLDRVLRSNLVGSILATKHFAPLMIRSGGGRIIYLSSIAAVQAWPGGAAKPGPEWSGCALGQSPG